MGMDIGVLTTQMIILLLLILCGYACGKAGILSKDRTAVLSDLVLQVGMPSMVLASVKDGSDVTLYTLIQYLIGFLLFNILTAVIAAVTVRILRVKKDRKLYEFMYMFSNIGFMGIPVVSATLGEEAVLYAALFLLPSNFVLFSYGENLMREERGFSWKKLVTPCMLASIAALILCILQVKIPYVFARPLEYLGNLTTPLAMMIIGSSLIGNSAVKMMKDKKLLGFCGVKLLVLPVVYWMILSLLPIPELISNLLILMMAMPVTSTTYVYASIYHRNTSLASQASILTSILCVVTIPAVFAFISLW